MRVAAWLTYNGAPFSGFARQNGQTTVQGSIEEALQLLFHREIETTCAGRTDAGVHALCQVVSFDLYDDEWFRRKPETLLRSLNALTHEAIVFRSVRPMPKDFSARFSAVSREYRYYLCIDEAAPLLMEAFSWHVGKPLDVEAMRRAAAHLVGEHDFKSFCMAVSAKGKPTNRFVGSIEFTRESVWQSNFIVMTVIGNAFLHSMVRTMVGTLVLVGLGKRDPDWVKGVLEARNRQAAGQNAPAQGLVLWNVEYEEGRLFFDPRPKSSSGEVDQTKHAVRDKDAIKGKETSGKGKSKKKKKAAKQADFLWGRRKQDKEWAREFAIPRGPIRLEDDVREEADTPEKVEELPVSDALLAQSDSSVVTPVEELPDVPEVSVVGSPADSKDLVVESPAASEASAASRISAGIPTELYVMPSRREDKVEPELHADPELRTDPEPHGATEITAPIPQIPEVERLHDSAKTPNDPNATATVLSAAGARARRRAREAAE